MDLVPFILFCSVITISFFYSSGKMTIFLLDMRNNRCNEIINK